MLSEDEYLDRKKALFEKYPYQFSRLFAYGFAVPHGWMDTVDTVCQQVDLLLTQHNVNKANFSWLQLKEKFGGLNLYWHGHWAPPEPNRNPDFLEEMVFPDIWPEDPNEPQNHRSNKHREYLKTATRKDWERSIKIPNPALANRPRDMSRYFDRTVSLHFVDEVSDEIIERVTLSVAREIMLPQNVTDAIRTFIEVAEVRAAATCQVCGEAGTRVVREDGWHLTACKEHAK